jgi:hypothetical protein
MDQQLDPANQKINRATINLLPNANGSGASPARKAANTELTACLVLPNRGIGEHRVKIVSKIELEAPKKRKSAAIYELES